MNSQSNSKGEQNRRAEVVSIICVVGALLLSTLALHRWGDRILVRSILGVCWGGYALYSFGPDAVRVFRELRNRMQ